MCVCLSRPRQLRRCGIGRAFMIRSSTLRMAAVLALAGAVAAPAVTPAFAYERWEHHGGWGGGHERHDWDRGPGVGLGGALLGLGVGAAVGAAIAGSAPPAYYAAPPAYYAPPPA